MLVVAEEVIEALLELVNEGVAEREQKAKSLLDGNKSTEREELTTPPVASSVPGGFGSSTPFLLDPGLTDTVLTAFAEVANSPPPPPPPPP